MSSFAGWLAVTTLRAVAASLIFPPLPPREPGTIGALGSSLRPAMISRRHPDIFAQQDRAHQGDAPCHARNRAESFDELWATMQLTAHWSTVVASAIPGTGSCPSSGGVHEAVWVKDDEGGGMTQVCAWCCLRVF